MDKTIEVIMVAAIAMIVALIGFMLVTGNAGDFGQTTGDNNKGATCELLFQRYKMAVQCSPTESDTPASSKIEEDADNNGAGQNLDCPQAFTPSNACS